MLGCGTVTFAGPSTSAKPTGLLVNGGMSLASAIAEILALLARAQASVEAGLSMYYVAQFMREQSHTVVD